VRVLLRLVADVVSLSELLSVSGPGLRELRSVVPWMDADCTAAGSWVAVRSDCYGRLPVNGFDGWMEECGTLVLMLPTLDYISAGAWFVARSVPIGSVCWSATCCWRFVEGW
jgi:hypothetical protein